MIGKKINPQEQGLTLISVVFVMLALSTMGLTLHQATSNRSASSMEDYDSTRAFYIADAGMEYVLAKEFAESSDFTTANTVNDISLNGGDFSSSYSSLSTNSGEVIITAQRANSVRQIRQMVQRVSGAPGAMMSGGNIDLVQSQAGTGFISGDVFYAGSYNASPAYNLSGSAQSGPAPAALDMEPYASMTTSTHNGNLVVSGNYTGSVHVTGDVTIAGPTSINGAIFADGNITISVQHNETLAVTGMLAANGNINGTFQHSSTCHFEPALSGPNIPPILVAQGDINLDFRQESVSLFQGLIRAGGDISLALRQEDQVSIEGALVANGNITLDVKQTTSLDLDFNAGYAYMSSYLSLTGWKEL